jgi:hypothetical protein
LTKVVHAQISHEDRREGQRDQAISTQKVNHVSALTGMPEKGDIGVEVFQQDPIQKTLNKNHYVR